MQTGMAQVENGELYYECAGEGPDVVLLHGGALDSTMWDEFFEDLSADHRVIRYDARSHGRSSAAAGDFRAYADLAAVLETVEAQRPVLIGLSLGGRTAIDFALAYPDVPAKLVLAATGVSGMEFVDPFVLECMRAQQEAVAAGDINGFVEGILRAWVDGPHRKADETPRGLRLRCAQMVTSTVRGHAAATGQMRELGALDRLGELRMPVLTLVGTLDSTDIIGVADRIVADAPDAGKVVIDGAAHMLNLEQPKAFTSAVREFLG